MYSWDLINVLSVLGNQAALAIENAIYIRDKGKSLMEQFHKQRLEGLGMLSLNVSHQMHNRFQAIIASADFANEMIKHHNPQDLTKEHCVELLEKCLKSNDTVIENCERGAEITEAIKNFAKADLVPKPVLFDIVIKNSAALVNLKHKDFRYELRREYPEDVVLWINFATMQDVIYNAIDNSCDAMKLKMKMRRDDHYQPTIVIRGSINNTMFDFEIEDNGMGIKNEHMGTIYVPLFTTKGSSNKGTGMGIHAIVQFVEQNKGTFRIESKYEQWTKLIISLPLATKEQRGANDENTIRR